MGLPHLYIEKSRWKQELRDQRGLFMNDHRFVTYEKYSRFGEKRICHMYWERRLCFRRIWAGTCKYYFSRGCGTRTMTVCQTRW